MESQNKAKEIVAQMMEADAFSQWLGIEVLDAKPAFSKLQMTVRKEMTNGLAVTHGGITYSLADSALAFASNAHGRLSMSIETSISHIHPVKCGDVLTAIAVEKNCSNKFAIYDIEIINQENVKVALFKGTVYRTSKEW
ncbi:MAG: hypothetical protein RI952_923 [Bacteroidota bacterium]|jgi:acyl-CoA thioesterase